MGACSKCMTRVPYATLIATIMCLVGIGVFCGTFYRGATLTRLLLENVFYLQPSWLEPLQLSLVIVGACMGAIGLIILIVGCLATGETRTKVYRAWSARVGGRVTCAVFLGLTYVLCLCWLALMCFLVIVTMAYTFCWALCAEQQQKPLEFQCIDFTQLSFLFPPGTKKDVMQVCEPTEVKQFCKDYVEKAEVMFVLASVACVLTLLSLIHYLMCLAANYAHIKDHEKLQDLQEMQFLQESEMSALSKDRF